MFLIATLYFVRVCGICWALYSVAVHKSIRKSLHFELTEYIYNQSFISHIQLKKNRNEIMKQKELQQQQQQQQHATDEILNMKQENNRNEKKYTKKETERNKSELFQMTHKAHRYRIAPWKKRVNCTTVALHLIHTLGTVYSSKWVESDSMIEWYVVVCGVFACLCRLRWEYRYYIVVVVFIGLSGEAVVSMRQRFSIF